MHPKSKSFYCFESSTSLRCWEINAKWQQPFWLQPVVGVCLEQRLYKTVNEMSHGQKNYYSHDKVLHGHSVSQSLGKNRWDQQWGLSLWVPHITLRCSTLLGESEDAVSIFPQHVPLQHTTSLQMWFCTNKTSLHARRRLRCPFKAALTST